MFSDLALSLSIEIEEREIEGLHKALSTISNLSEFDVNSIRAESEKDWTIFLNISFSDGTGNLAQEVPDVLG